MSDASLTSLHCWLLTPAGNGQLASMPNLHQTADQELPERQPAHPLGARFSSQSVTALPPITPSCLLQIKSYLSGSPPIRLGLSENLILGRKDQRMLSSYGSDAGACFAVGWASQCVCVLLTLGTGTETCACSAATAQTRVCLLACLRLCV